MQPVHCVAELQLAQLDCTQAKQVVPLKKNPILQTEHWLAPKQEKQFLTLQISQLLPPPLLLTENPEAHCLQTLLLEHPKQLGMLQVKHDLESDERVKFPLHELQILLAEQLLHCEMAQVTQVPVVLTVRLVPEQTEQKLLEEH